MAFVPIPDAMEATVEFTWDSQIVCMVFGFSTSGLEFTTQAPKVYAALNAGLWPNLRLALSTGIVSSGVRVIDLSAANAGAAEFPPFTTPSGSVNTASVPNNVAACVTLSTAQRGRSYQGRKYVPGLADGSRSGNYVTLAAEEFINDGFAGLLASAQGQGVPLVVLSRVANKVPRTIGVQTLVTSAQMNDRRLDTQRRRLPGVGS